MGENTVPCVLTWAEKMAEKLAWAVMLAGKVAWAKKVTWAVMQNQRVLNLNVLVPCKTRYYGMFSNI
ncbi:hypothetical protein AAC387_Pa04g1893 [Persea americana]